MEHGLQSIGPNVNGQLHWSNFHLRDFCGLGDVYTRYLGSDGRTFGFPSHPSFALVIICLSLAPRWFLQISVSIGQGGVHEQVLSRFGLYFPSLQFQELVG